MRLRHGLVGSRCSSGGRILLSYLLTSHLLLMMHHLVGHHWIRWHHELTAHATEHVGLHPGVHHAELLLLLHVRVAHEAVRIHLRLAPEFGLLLHVRCVRRSLTTLELL